MAHRFCKKSAEIADRYKKKLVLKSGDSNQLTAFVHASWRKSYEKEKRSGSGLLVSLGDLVVAAATSLKCVRVSSTESEYVSLYEAVKSIVWLEGVLAKYEVKQESPCIFQDNISFIEQTVGKAANI